MPKLTRIIFTVTEDEAELLSAFLSQHIAHGWAENSLPGGTLTATVHLPVEHTLPALEDAFSNLFPGGTIHQDSVEEENWAEAWKEFFTPVKGGDHFYVLAPWMEEELKNTSLIPILIEPKTAFGTGHHGSTSLCLDMISTLFGNRVITNETSFLDLGTGSGILGIACAKLGLSGTGLDIDPIAIANALENRELNNIPPEQFQLACGTQDDAQGPYGLIIANILAGPLQQMAPCIIELLGPAHGRGHLILSGILATQALDVADTYTSLGLPEPEIRIKGEWASLYFAPSALV